MLRKTKTRHVYSEEVKKDVQISARVTSVEKEDFENLCEKINVKPSEVMRVAVLALMKYFKKHDHKILLPLDFEETFVVKTWKKRNGKNAKAKGEKKI